MAAKADGFFQDRHSAIFLSISIFAFFRPASFFKSTYKITHSTGAAD